MKAVRFVAGEIGRTIPDIIRAGESARVEFKSTIRFDMEKMSINRGLETVIAKTIAGLANTRGDNLVIGVDDEGTVVGLEHDYGTLRDPSRDGFERAVIDIVRRQLGGDLSTLVHFSFAELDGKDVCMLVIEASPRIVYMDDGGKSSLFIRTGNSTRKLDVHEAVDYVKRRWQDED